MTVEALVPYEVIRERYDISRVTLWRRIRDAGDVEPVTLPDGSKALRFADVVRMFESNH